jgi:hypothetical protein
MPLNGYRDSPLIQTKKRISSVMTELQKNRTSQSKLLFSLLQCGLVTCLVLACLGVSFEGINLVFVPQEYWGESYSISRYPDYQEQFTQMVTISNPVWEGIYSCMDLVCWLCMVLVPILFFLWLFLHFKKVGTLRKKYLELEDLPYSPIWAIAYWFIPVLNLWMPCLILQSLWKASAPEASQVNSSTQWHQLPPSHWISIFWGLTLLAFIAPIALILFVILFVIVSGDTNSLSKEILQINSVATYFGLTISLGILGILQAFATWVMVKQFEERIETLSKGFDP